MPTNRKVFDGRFTEDSSDPVHRSGTGGSGGANLGRADCIGYDCFHQPMFPTVGANLNPAGWMGWSVIFLASIAAPLGMYRWLYPPAETWPFWNMSLATHEKRVTFVTCLIYTRRGRMWHRLRIAGLGHKLRGKGTGDMIR
jgi:hypothetical protein